MRLWWHWSNKNIIFLSKATRQVNNLVVIKQMFMHGSHAAIPSSIILKDLRCSDRGWEPNLIPITVVSIVPLCLWYFWSKFYLRAFHTSLARLHPSTKYNAFSDDVLVIQLFRRRSLSFEVEKAGLDTSSFLLLRMVWPGATLLRCPLTPTHWISERIWAFQMR